MFDAAINAMVAWNQLLLMLSGLLMLGIGGLLIGDFIWWRATATRLKGCIVGVRAINSSLRSSQLQTNTNKTDTNVEVKKESSSFAEEFKKSPGTGSAALFFAFIMVGIPLLFFCIGAYFGYDYLALKAKGTQTEALVTGQDQEYDSESGTSYYALITFTDSSGTTRQVRDRMGSGKPTYKTGERIVIHYDPKQPDHFVTSDFWHNMILPIAFMGIGSLFLILVFGGAFNKKETKEKMKPNHSYQNEMYYPIFEYTLKNGETLRAEGQNGSNWIADKIPGTKLTLLVDPNDPEKVKRPGYIGLIVGLIFAVPGLIMIYISLSHYEINIFTIIIGLGIIGYGAFRFISGLEAKTGKRDLKVIKAQFKKRMKDKFNLKRQKGKILSVEEFRDRLRYWDKVTGWWIPVMGIIASAMIAGGYYWGSNQSEFASVAISTSGTVIEVESVYNSSSDGSSYTYYPIVSFKDRSGHSHRFKDSVGSNPQSYFGGEAVAVLYDPEDPNEAMIDRGWLNWLPMIALIVLGLLLFIHTIRLTVSIRGRAGRI